MGSLGGWVRSRQGWEVEGSTLSFKEGDSLLSLIRCRTVDPVVFLDSGGRAYSLTAGDLPPARPIALSHVDATSPPQDTSR